MTDQPEEPGTAAATDDAEGAGVEIGMTEGEGTTFEPEEDPEAQSD